MRQSEARGTVGPTDLVHCFWCWIFSGFSFFFYISHWWGSSVRYLVSLWWTVLELVKFTDRQVDLHVFCEQMVVGSKMIQYTVEHRSGHLSDKVSGWAFRADTAGTLPRSPLIFSHVSIYLHHLLGAFAFSSGALIWNSASHSASY